MNVNSKNENVNGVFVIREAGKNYFENIVPNTEGSYNTGDIFGIIYDTINFTYIKNGNSILTTRVPNAKPEKLYLDGSMFHPGTLIQNVYFGVLNDCPATS